MTKNMEKNDQHINPDDEYHDLDDTYHVSEVRKDEVLEDKEEDITEVDDMLHLTTTHNMRA